MAGKETGTAPDLIAEGRALAPWHLDVEITPELSTRDFADAPYPESFGQIRVLDRRERFKDTLKRVFSEDLAGRSVLDCACNCGGFLFWARELGAGHCHGIDVREHWIEQARFLGRHRTMPSDDMLFEVGNLYDLPERGLEPFDVVLFNGIYYHLPDPIAGLQVAADLAREILIVETSTTITIPDGQLVVSEETPERPVSGVYGLNWFPSGPGVIARQLEWLGFEAVRVNWWRRLPTQQPIHARLEMVAARDARALEHFEGLEQRPALVRRVEQSVPPEATVLVLSPEGEPAVAFEERRAVAFPARDAGHDDDALLAELIRLRGEGAGYFLIPDAAAAWLTERPLLNEHIRTSYLRVAREPEGVLFSLLPTWRTK
jgi:tRNA (mo5U34)-methyltransferase